MPVLIGTAGWSLPRAEQQHFPAGESHLERYAARFAAAEINSSFHRPHRASTWARWRDSVPSSFRFSVKLPKTITHTARLKEADELLSSFLKEVAALEGRIGCLLVQLPPALSFDPDVAENFFKALRNSSKTPVACEPRNASWFTAEADELLQRHKVARVAADPARVTEAASPGGCRGLTYYRLHGSPKIYYSSYSADFLSELAGKLEEEHPMRDVWVIFDNTTLAAATRNALELAEVLAGG